MSDAENHHHGKNEIVVIKRHGGGDHDGAHGGAWKIAYADFMTAMMAFFLVMWLVNAANEETKASVASYFNPIKLADEKPTEKGLKKPVDQAEGEQNQNKSDQPDDNPSEGSSAATGEDQTATSGDQANYSEADFFENPYSVLAEIAQEVGQQANVSAKGEGGAADSGPSTGAEGGEAYRDPFDPDFWTQQVQNRRGKPGEPDIAAVTPVEGQADPTGLAVPEQQVAVAIPREKPPELLDRQLRQAPQPADAQAAEAAQETAGAEATQKADAEKEKQALELREAIEKQIDGVSGKLAEGLLVTPSEGGLLITISDQQNAPMFNVGSAVPRKEMVLAMEKIGSILDKRPGKVVVRGHTDSRQFKGETNDNWSLSVDRAHSAYFMLVRGGLEKDRISQLAGYADTRLQVPEDPLANANRRIEILLQADQD